MFDGEIKKLMSTTNTELEQTPTHTDNEKTHAGAVYVCVCAARGRALRN